MNDFVGWEIFLYLMRMSNLDALSGMTLGSFDLLLLDYGIAITFGKIMQVFAFRKFSRFSRWVDESL